MNKISISKKCWTNSKWGCNFSKQQSFSLSIFDMLSCYFLLNKAFNVFINFCFFILFLWKWSWLVKLLYTNSFLSFWTRLWMVHLKTATTWKHQIVVKSMCVCVCLFTGRKRPWNLLWPSNHRPHSLLSRGNTTTLSAALLCLMSNRWLLLLNSRKTSKSSLNIRKSQSFEAFLAMLMKEKVDLVIMGRGSSG